MQLSYWAMSTDHTSYYYPPPTTTPVVTGRYFACSTHCIAVNVISKRLHREEVEREYMYYVNDGVYGSFNCILYDHNIPTPTVLKVRKELTKVID